MSRSFYCNFISLASPIAQGRRRLACVCTTVFQASRSRKIQLNSCRGRYKKQESLYSLTEWGGTGRGGWCVVPDTSYKTEGRCEHSAKPVATLTSQGNGSHYSQYCNGEFIAAAAALRTCCYETKGGADRKRTNGHDAGRSALSLNPATYTHVA